MYSIRATFPNLVLKGHHTRLQWTDDRDTVKIIGSKRPVSALCASLVPELLKNAFYLLWIRIKSPYQWYKSSLSKIFLCLRIQICLPKTHFWLINTPIAQIPQCTKHISHNAPFCNRNMLENCALWVICLMHSTICEMDDLYWFYFLVIFKDENITKDGRTYWI